jgi:hypothetical protein
MREAVTLAILGSLFAASVLNQIPIRPWQVLVARFDPWTFLPFWGFFGPNPAFAGVHLIYRDKNAAGWTGWDEIEIPGANGWLWLWNPTRHERKALHDLLNGLAQTAAEVGDQNKVVLSNCHLALLAWAVAQPRKDPNALCRQFVLVEAIGHSPVRQLRPVFVSREFSFG